jgi:hypothetical protein
VHETKEGDEGKKEERKLFFQLKKEPQPKVPQR